MINLDYVREKKKDAVEKWYQKEYDKSYRPKSEIYRNAVILPLREFPNDGLQFGRGGVIDESGNYVESSGITGRIALKYDFSNPEYKDEKVVYCGYLINQWGHFLVEAITRLWYFLKNDESVDKYIFFISSEEKRNIKGNYKQFFELLGIWDKLEIINKPTKYREVIVPERSFAIGKYWSQDYKNIFQKIVDSVQLNPNVSISKKIFLSRSHIPNVEKKEFNMDMLDEFFRKNGYDVVYPEALSLSELIVKMQNAEIVASMSGSTQHNILFAPDNIKHIVIEKTIVPVDFTIAINRLKNLDVIYIDANLPIYPVSIGYGPYIMKYSGMLEKFAKDFKYLPADPSFETPKRMRMILRKYWKIYQTEYQYQWFLMDWEQQFIAAIREGYYEGFEYYKPYLTRQKPFLFRHYFELHYYKPFIKKLLGR